MRLRTASISSIGARATTAYDTSWFSRCARMLSTWSTSNEHPTHCVVWPGPIMKCLMKSWLRPSNRSASVTCRFGPSKTYSFSTLTHGRARRSLAKRSRSLVSSFSLARSAVRAVSHSSRDTTRFGSMVQSPCALDSGAAFAPASSGRGLFFGPVFARSLLASSAASPPVELALATVSATVVRHAGHMDASAPLRSRVGCERGHLVGKCLLEGGPCLASQAVGLEHWHLSHHICVAQDAQHGRHEQVRRGEPILKIVPPTEPAGQVHEPRLCSLDCRRPAQLCPFLLGVKQIDLGKILDPRLDRVEGGEHPRRHPGPALGVGRHQRLGPLRHVQHDGTGLEQYQPVLLVRRHLPERLKATIALGHLILWPDQPLLVRQGRLFEHPTHAEVTYEAARKRRYPAKRTHSDHERLVLTPTSAHANCAEWAGVCSRGCPRCR